MSRWYNRIIPDYGIDLDCAYDLTLEAHFVSGLSGLARAVYRRLTTPRGMVIDAPDYGDDVRSLLHLGQTPTQRAAIPGLIRSEILKDERILAADIEVTAFTHDSIVLTIRCEAGEGPFELVLNIAAAAVKLAATKSSQLFGIRREGTYGAEFFEPGGDLLAAVGETAFAGATKIIALIARRSAPRWDLGHLAQNRIGCRRAIEAYVGALFRD